MILPLWMFLIQGNLQRGLRRNLTTTVSAHLPHPNAHNDLQGPLFKVLYTRQPCSRGSQDSNTLQSLFKPLISILIIFVTQLSQIFLRNYRNFYEKFHWSWKDFLNYKLMWLKEFIGLAECPLLCFRHCPWRAVSVYTDIYTLYVQLNMIKIDLQGSHFTCSFKLTKSSIRIQKKGRRDGY